MVTIVNFFLAFSKKSEKLGTKPSKNHNINKIESESDEDYNIISSDENESASKNFRLFTDTESSDELNTGSFCFTRSI